MAVVVWWRCTEGFKEGNTDASYPTGPIEIVSEDRTPAGPGDYEVTIGYKEL